MAQSNVPNAPTGGATVTPTGGAAILAPSYWNAQPWRFEVDANELRLTLDPGRTLPFCDPDQRFALLSLGAALENLLVAARAWGLQPAVQYLPFGTHVRHGASLVAARITWLVSIVSLTAAPSPPPSPPVPGAARPAFVPPRVMAIRPAAIAPPRAWPASPARLGGADARPVR